VVTFTAADGTHFDGDEVRLLARQPATFQSIDSFVINAHQINSLTVTNEKAVLSTPPTLSIQRMGDKVVLSWLDPNSAYFVESTQELTHVFSSLSQEADFDGTHGRLILDASENALFFRLHDKGSVD